MPYDDVGELNYDLVWLFNEGQLLKGTGRLIARDLILTAAHLLFKTGQTTPVLHGWQAFREGDRPDGKKKQSWSPRSCDEVVWYGKDCIPDLALLRLEPLRAGSWRPHLSLRVATLRGNATPKVEARGYPRASLDTGPQRSLVVATGELRATDECQPLTFSINPSDVPNHPHNDWKGMSGSPVFLHDPPTRKEVWVFGVIQEVPGNFDSQFRVARLADALREVRDILTAAGVADHEAIDPNSPAHRRGISRSKAYHRAVVETDEHLRAGGLLPALDALVKSFTKSWEPDDGWLAWERLAYRLSDCFVSTPLEQAPFGGTPVALDVSANGWFVAIGCADGATFVQQLRLPIHVDGEDLSAREEGFGPRYLHYDPSGLRMGLSGARATIPATSSGSGKCGSQVRFLPGGVRSMPLEVTWPPAGGGARFFFSHIDLEKQSQRQGVAGGLYAVGPTYDPIEASVGLDGRLIIRRLDGRRVECLLEPRTQDDSFIGMVFLTDMVSTLDLREPATVACVSRRGRYYHLDANGVSLLTNLQSERVNFLDMTIQAEVDSVSAHGRTLLVSTGAEVLLFRHDEPGRILAYEGRRITAAALLGEHECCLGYEDGVVETFRFSHRSCVSRRCLAHNGSVLELKPCWTQDPWSPANTFLSIGADGVAQVWPGPDGRPSHVVLPQVTDIRTAGFAEHG
jgi:hypothetical protein